MIKIIKNFKKLSNFKSRFLVSAFLLIIFIVLFLLSSFISPIYDQYNIYNKYPIIKINREYQIIPFFILSLIYLLFSNGAFKEMQNICFNNKKYYLSISIINFLISFSSFFLLFNLYLSFYKFNIDSNWKTIIFQKSYFIIFIFIWLFLIFFKYFYIYLIKKKPIGNFIKLNLIYLFSDLIISLLPVFILYTTWAFGWLSILYFSLIIWSTDIGAWFFGILYGKKKIMPSVSPKKSYAGLFGAIISSIIITIIFYILLYLCIQNNKQFIYIFIFKTTLSIKNIYIFIIFTVIVSIISQMGDFYFSFIKRKNNTKDFSKILKKHGGLLDRFDGYIFSAFWILLVIIVWSL